MNYAARKTPFYKKLVYIFVLNIFLSIRVFLIWRYTFFKKSTKVIISLIFTIFFVITLILPNIDSNEESDTSNHQQETKDSNKIEIPLQIQMKILKLTMKKFDKN